MTEVLEPAVQPNIRITPQAKPAHDTIGSSTVADLARAPGSEPVAPTVDRPGRAIIGWMSPDQAVHILHGGRAGVATTDEEAALIAAASAAVNAREPYVNCGPDVIKPIDASLEHHLQALMAAATAAPYFADGWRVVLADLSRVCAYQPTVITDHAAERMSGVKTDDFQSIAHVTLPIAARTSIDASFDEQRSAFVITSANPNLRVLSYGIGQDPNGLPDSQSVVFNVGALASYVQVFQSEGRYYLRDGYHRAVALLARGVTYAPVFFHENIPWESCIPNPAQMLPRSAYAGPRPPMLTDFNDDAVSCDVQLPAIRKLVLVQANELVVRG